MIPKLTRAEKALIEQIRAKVDLDFKENFTLQQLAQQFHLTETRLRYGFLQLFGVSVLQYRTRKRLEYFISLLKSEEVSISEAAYESGYNDISTFNRTFKKEYSMSPSQWKKQFLSSKVAFLICCLSCVV